MDADGGRVVHRGRRTRKLAVVVAAQNVLVIVSLLVTLYVYLDVQSRTPSAEWASEDNVHIRFNDISDILGSGTLQFGEVKSNNMMHLADKKKDQIYVNCTGPYVLYMHLCYMDVDEKEANGTLQLQVVRRERRETPVSFSLQASHVVCRGLHGIAYLKAKDNVRLHLNCTGGFKIKNMTVGLSYLLGSQCDF